MFIQVKKDKLKGTITVSDLWPNKSTVHFLKENQMFFNKARLVQELHTYSDDLKKSDET